MPLPAVDLATTYLGLPLAHPVMGGACPFTNDLDVVRQLEDAGASAIVMHSLFEEQLTQDQMGMAHHVLAHEDAHAEARSYFPEPEDFVLGPERYLEQVHRIKEAVKVPVIASLNGTTADGWLSYAQMIQQAGADAVELNVYHVATSLTETGASVEQRVLDIAAVVRESVHIPIAVKLSPYFSSVAHLAHQLDTLGVDGLVLFNRFYQPDIDPERLDTVPSLRLSDPSELLLRLRWLAILAGRIRPSLAANGGVHSGLDAVKALMAGAHVVQLVSALLRHGPQHLTSILEELTRWMVEHEYDTLADLRGSMSLLRCPDPEAFERGNYMRILQTWRPADGPGCGAKRNEIWI